MKDKLVSLGTFYYWPNDGNLGDLLIAEATRQYFRRLGLIWKEFDPELPPTESHYNLVYGGGGRFTSHWEGVDKLQSLLTAPCVKQGVILSHSFYQVDAFLRGLDERHTVVCRERKSYDYVCSLELRASVMLGHDLGLSLVLAELPALSDFPAPSLCPGEEEKMQLFLLRSKWVYFLAKGVKRSTVCSQWPEGRRKVAFLLRTDEEKAAQLSSSLSYDISLAWQSSCAVTAYNTYFIRAFAEAVRYPDIIVTDRLHVAIMAHHLGKEVYMLDNDYGKLRAVYEHSLREDPRIHMLSDKTLPQEILESWAQLNDIWHRAWYRLRVWKRLLRERIRRVR